MFLKNRRIFITALLSVLLVSCSKYQKILKSSDHEMKFQKANEYFEREDYYRALNLYEQLLPVYRATEKAETIYYNYAYAYYNQRDYVLASYYFKRFVKTFPRSEKAEECFYMSAYCKYLESPVYSLDQTNTFEAIDELQLFINSYPDSERVEKCNDLIDELREKLQKKQFEIARLYLKMDHYTAAVAAFENLMEEYPSTKYREEALYYIIRANYLYAQKSVSQKKEERYLEAIEAYDNFKAVYPDSRFNRDAFSMYESSLKETNIN